MFLYSRRTSVCRVSTVIEKLVLPLSYHDEALSANTLHTPTQSAVLQPHPEVRSDRDSPVLFHSIAWPSIKAIYATSPSNSRLSNSSQIYLQWLLRSSWDCLTCFTNLNTWTAFSRVVHLWHHEPVEPHCQTHQLQQWGSRLRSTPKSRLFHRNQWIWRIPDR